MGTGFVIYDSFDLFKERTRLNFEDVRFNQKVRDIYTWTDSNKKDHLIITTDYVVEDARPDLERTVILLHGDNTKKVLETLPGLRLVKWNEIRFEPEKKVNSTTHVTFGLKSKWFGLRKVPYIWFPVIYRAKDSIPKKKQKVFTSLRDLPSDAFGVIAYDSVRDIVNIVSGVWYSELENNDIIR